MIAEKIMIVDDNKEFMDELKETLLLCGYNAKGTSDSSAALRLASRMKPNLILLDLKMNGMNGFTVAQQLKRQRETSGIPVIAMSGYFPVENGSLLLDMSNMDGRIAKPFAFSDLIAQIEKFLSKKESLYNPGEEDAE